MAKSRIQFLLDAMLGETIKLDLGSEAALPSSDLISLGISTGPDIRQPAPAYKSVPFDFPKVAEAPSGVAIIDLGQGAYSQLYKKPNVELLRNYAKYSTWVRAAIDYHRRMLGRAYYEIVQIDTTHKMNRRDKNAKAAVESLLLHPNAADESYGQLKEIAIEDYLVIGHGCIELDLNRDLTVRSMRTMDSALVGFVKKWDGTDRSVPRFCVFKDKYGTIVDRYLAHEQVFCLVNRPMSDTKLGFSHVEALHRSVTALLSGEDLLINMIKQPIPDTLLSLGEGVTPQQVESFRQQIRSVKEKLAIVGGAKGAEVHRLSATPAEMNILDGQEWFVRHVAAIFGMSTAKLKLAVDTSRANTAEMYSDDLEAITGELTRIEELETATYIQRYAYDGDINLRFSYPIMHRKDEESQAKIAKESTGQSWTSVNEARTRTGEKPLEENQFPYANEVLVQIPKGPPVPWSIWAAEMEKRKNDLGKEQDQEQPAEPENTDPDTSETDDQSSNNK